MVRDSGVNVHASVVLRGVDIMRHVGRLGIVAKNWIIVCAARRFHRTQRNPLDALRKQTSADQPVRLGGRLLQRVLLHKRSEYVGNRLIQRAGRVEQRRCRQLQPQWYPDRTRSKMEGHALGHL